MANQTCTPGVFSVAPERSITVAPDSRAAERLRSVNAAEPVKKMSLARSKVPSSTGWMTAGSPPASVSVPATVSSSTNERSQLANRLSSRRDFSSAPSGEEAPAITIRWESLEADMKSRGPRRSNAMAEDANDLQDQ